MKVLNSIVYPAVGEIWEIYDELYVIIEVKDETKVPAPWLANIVSMDSKGQMATNQLRYWRQVIKDDIARRISEA